LSKKENIDAFDFSKKNELNAEEIYKRFYHFDYAMRKLLPPLFKAYEIHPAKDLKD
ncbi:CmeU family protein, partial [Campylobacter upsaliensis]